MESTDLENKERKPLPFRKVLSVEDLRRFVGEYTSLKKKHFKDENAQKNHEFRLARYELTIAAGVRGSSVTKSRNKNRINMIKNSRKNNRRTKGRTQYK